MSSRKRGVDSLLTARGKNLKQGESCSFRLIKGPAGTITADPVDPKAPKQRFPVMAKFPESVVKPDFTHKPWVDGRLYQQDVPKVQDDSDEEASAKKEPKKRWKGYKRQEVVARQWVLQEQVDFLETMVARREKKPLPQNKLSSRYEGIPENNASHYALFLQSGSNIQVMTLPSSPMVIFSQPAARKTLSLTEAEQVIQDQRMGIRTMHHLVDQDKAAADAAAAASSTANATPMAGLGPRRLIKKNSSKSRLLDKLKRQVKADDVEEADDIMGDVTFRNRKGTGGGARKELLQSLGDGVKVGDDGVLGGIDDAVFGGRQRFVNFQAEQHKAGAGDKGESGANAERGADGAAMADDFYQRDVHAEYEELDYDANELFDDDDVDVGETEVVVEGGYEQDDEEEDDDEIEQEEAVAGAEGLASVAGFKMMLAKARGEVTTPQGGPTPGDGTEAANGEKKAGDSAPTKHVEENDTLSRIIAAAEKDAEDKKKEKFAKKPTASAIQVDENGLRIIDLNAVRNEIWLNHGSIPVKRLMKIFDVKGKSSADRQERFREVIKELCAMKTDPVGGKILVLKQHYAH